MDEFPPLVFDVFFPWFGDSSYGRTPEATNPKNTAVLTSVDFWKAWATWGDFGILDP